MTNAFDVIVRGVDSSGRLIKGTRQSFQFYDRLNILVAGGILVIVQGGWSFAAASANTHRLGMCCDYRSWNLDAALRTKIVHAGRDLGGTMYYRIPADGFDEHIHNNLIGDHPADPVAIAQVADYKRGLNGLYNHRADRDPYRPSRITDYKYLEDYDMFEPDDRALLKKISADLDRAKTRDQKEKARDKARYEKLITAQGNIADELTLLINHTEDSSTKQDLKKLQEKILLQLKEDPDVTGKDNPADSALGEMNLG